MVPNKTPFALLSCFFLMKIKNINKLEIAANDNTFPYKPPSLIIFKVSLKLYIEKYSKYKKIPAKVAKKEIKMPIRMSFFRVPKSLIFESYDVLLNRTELVQLKHIRFLMHRYRYLDPYLY